jgi:hypothetical protein
MLPLFFILPVILNNRGIHILNFKNIRFHISPLNNLKV